MATEAKSKRDLMWEQKRKQREARMNKQPADLFANNQPEPQINPDFSKKSPLFPGNELPDKGAMARQEPVMQQMNDPNPFGNKQPFQDNSNHLQQQINMQGGGSGLERGGGMQQPEFPPKNQPTSLQGVDHNENNPFRDVQPKKAVNFNPSFEPSVQQYQEPTSSNDVNHQSIERAEYKKKQNDYGDFLRRQMEEKEKNKQMDKRYQNQGPGMDQQLQQQPQGNQNGYQPPLEQNKFAEKQKKRDYGDYLRNQMKEQEVRKSHDIDQKRGVGPKSGEQNLGAGDFFSNNRGGGGAPIRDMNGNVNTRIKGGYEQQASGQQQPPYPKNQFVQSQNQPNPYGQQQQLPPSNNYHHQQMQQQQQQQPPFSQNQTLDRASSNANLNQNDPSSFNQGNRNYIQAENGEDVKQVIKKIPLESNHPQEIAKRERIVNDYQRELREQIEQKQRKKKEEEERKKQEDMQDYERIKREQEFLERKYKEEKEQELKKNRAINAENQANGTTEHVVAEKKPRRRHHHQNTEESNQNQMNQNQNNNNDNQNYYQNQPPPQSSDYQQQQQQPQYPPQQQQYPPNQYQGGQYQQPPTPNGMMPPYQQQPPMPNMYNPYQQPMMGYNNPMQNGMMDQQNKVSSEINQIRSEIQNQQNVLAQQLQAIKNEAQVAMDERNKAENELLKLREQLKQKVMTEEIYKTNLKSALEKNSNLKVQRVANQITKNEDQGKFHPELYDKRMENANKNYKPLVKNDSSKEDNFANQVFQIKQTNEQLKHNQSKVLGLNNSVTQSYGNFELNRTLDHDSAHIPLQVFDQNGKLMSGEQHPLTMSKIQNYAIRPSSSRAQDQKLQGGSGGDDALDYMMKNQKSNFAAMRPNSQEQSRDYLSTTNLIGKNLDEADAILGGGSNLYGTSNKLKSRGTGGGGNTGTLSNAAKNVLASDKELYGYSHQYKQGGGRVGSKGNGMIAGDKLQKLDGYDGASNFGDETGNYSMKAFNIGDGGIPLAGESTHNYDLTNTKPLHGISSLGGGGTTSSAGGHGGGYGGSHAIGVEPLNTSHALNQSSGSTFNLEKINMMNEARLKNLDKMGGYGNSYDTMADRGKNNYYNGPGLNPHQNKVSENHLATIKENDDDAPGGGEGFHKLDNLLLNYYKSDQQH